MTRMPLIVLPCDYRDVISACGKRSGVFDITISDREDLMVVDGWGYRSSAHGDVHTRGYAKEFAARHFLRSTKKGSGFWYRVEPDLHRHWVGMAWRDACMGAGDLRRNVTGWYEPGGGDLITPILTFAEIDGQTSVLAWEIRRGQAIPARLDIVDVASDRLAPLVGHWPVDDLADAKIVVVGVGSIGSAACDALVAYGARRLKLIDPDHLYWHNFARHTTGRSQAGRFKVHAVAQHLQDRDDCCRLETSTSDGYRRRRQGGPDETTWLGTASRATVARDGGARDGQRLPQLVDRERHDRTHPYVRAAANRASVHVA